MEPVRTINYKNHKINIVYDELANPREDFDNLGTFYSNKRNFSPDGHNIEELIRICDGNVYDSQIPWDKIDKHFIYVKVWMYDHSGQTVRAGETNPFSCPWDSGLAGILAVSKDKAKKEYGYKIVSKSLKDKVKKYLSGEVSTLDDALNGNVYGYQVVNESDEVIDSCFGYYGSYDDNSDIVQEAMSVIDSLVA